MSVPLSGPFATLMSCIKITCVVYHVDIHYEGDEIYLEHVQGEDGILVTSATLSKWGNSIAVRIPNQIVKRLNLQEGYELEVIVTNGQDIVLRPKHRLETNEDLRQHLQALLSNITPESRHDEIDWGTTGRELI